MKIMKLWESDIPGYTDGGEIPTLAYYPTEHKRGRGTVLIFAGGAYRIRSPHEGEGYAKFLNSIGLDAFVLEYRVKPVTFPYPLLDARRAMRMIRNDAEIYGIDPEKIAVMGSSAGGHLAALVTTYKDKVDGEGRDALDGVDCTPNAQILCYPVLDIQGHSGSFVNLLGDKLSTNRSVTPYHLADKDTPPLFLWHTSCDKAVDVGGSFRYASRLHELGISVEMHVYPIGVHGLGLANIEDRPERMVPYVQNWAMHLEKWLELNGWIEK